MFLWVAVVAAAQVGPGPVRVEQDYGAPGGWLPRLALTAERDPVRSPLVVTHKRVRLEVLTADLWPVRLTAALDDPDQGGPQVALVPPAGRWGAVELDTGAACGVADGLSLSVAAVHPDLGLGSPTLYVGSIAQVGEVCPQFRDADADGRCTQGFDRDGDGFCVGADEPAPPGPPVDCNDTSPGPRCLVLEVRPGVEEATLAASGAQPGEEVWFFGSATRGQSCPPALGGVCMDLTQPRMLGAIAADEHGGAELRVPLHRVAWFQAGLLRVGLDSDLSAAVQASGAVAEPEPIADR